MLLYCNLIFEWIILAADVSCICMKETELIDGWEDANLMT